MEMRSGAHAAPVWGWRCFLRGYGVFYAQATGVQEENQIGRGAAHTTSTALQTVINLVFLNKYVSERLGLD